MKITRIFHAAVNVAGKLDEAKAFYTELLGLPEVQVNFPGIDASDLSLFWIEQAGVQMHAIGFPSKPEGDALGIPAEEGGPNAMNHHISWYVEDIDDVVADLESAGKKTAIIGEGRARVVWTLDPSGNTVEFQQDPNF